MSRKVNSAVVIGAGPVGLAAAAHLLERGIEPLVLEAGHGPGHAVGQWSHVRLFSPWEFNVDTASRRLLENTGWTAPDKSEYPTGADLLVRYLRPLAEDTALRTRIRFGSRVAGVSRVGLDKVKMAGRGEAPFEVRYETAAGSRTVTADAVVDASGTWSMPSPAGANGLPAVGEVTGHARITYGMPDVLGSERSRYEGRTVAVLGAGHSAIGTILDLDRLRQTSPSTIIVWLVRGKDIGKAFGGGANDALAARGELGTAIGALARQGGVRVETDFKVTEVSATTSALTIHAGDGRSVEVDELVVATGFRPDLSFLSELRVSLDPALECPPVLAPLIDPNLHSCGTVRPHGAVELAHPEPAFYVAGMKSYGRAPTFLMTTGYEQVRSIAAELAGDHEAARRVELVLPETGVCSGGGISIAPSSNCCGGPPQKDEAACCRTDEVAKVETGSGCGCSSKATAAVG